MKNTLYELLKPHVGHKIEIVEHDDHICIEDIDTNEVLIDTATYNANGNGRLVDADALLEKAREVDIYNALYGATFAADIVYVDDIEKALKDAETED